MNIPQLPEADDLAVAMHEALLRLTDAGWVKRSLVSDDVLWVEFTPFGLQRLTQMQQCFAEIGWMGTTGDWICLEGLCWMAHARALGPTPTAPERQPPFAPW